jgi:stage V sporulation protein AF
MRVFLLLMSWLFSFAGFFIGLGGVALLLLTNSSFNGRHSYLYPLIPFNARAMGRLLIRRKK